MYTAEQLNSELHRLGIIFLAGDHPTGFSEPISPAELIAGLATQSDARMRSAIIALFLQCPDFDRHVPGALKILSAPHRNTLCLYYTAAYYLQLTYWDDLRRILGQYQQLPDYFSAELAIFPSDATSEAALRQLANRHQEITGLAINWYGTYHHVAQRVISRLEKELEWSRG